MAGSPSSVLDHGRRRRKLLNSHPEAPPRHREKVEGLFSTDHVGTVCRAVSQLSLEPVAVGDVLELCRKSAAHRVTASHESTQERNHIDTRNNL